jgi:hypothetical protein
VVVWWCGRRGRGICEFVCAECHSLAASNRQPISLASHVSIWPGEVKSASSPTNIPIGCRQVEQTRTAFNPFPSPQEPVRTFTGRCPPNPPVCTEFDGEDIVDHEQPLSKLATALQSPSKVAHNTHVPDISPCHAHHRQLPISKVYLSLRGSYSNLI